MTLAEAVAALEARFPVGPHGTSALAVTGEPFVTICCGGIKAENEPHPALACDEATAVRLWLEAVERYADAVKAAHHAKYQYVVYPVDGAIETAAMSAMLERSLEPTWTLYWREEPELQRFQMTVAETRGHRMCEDRWAVYSRLLVSAVVVGAPKAPVVAPQVESKPAGRRRKAAA